jgi:hypothetical protein
MFETPLRAITRKPHPDVASTTPSPTTVHSTTLPTPPIRALRSGRDEEYLQLEDDAFELERIYEVELGKADHVKAMIRQADEFYDYGLKSRAMREWLAELEWEKVRQQTASSARQAICR